MPLYRATSTTLANLVATDGATGGFVQDSEVTAFARTVLDDESASDALKTLGAWEVLAASTQISSHTGDTSETILATITIPAGKMGANGRILLSFVATCTENANAKTLRVRLGGIGGTGYLGNSLANFETARTELEIVNVNSESSQKGWVASFGTFGTSTATPVTSAIDTSAETTLLITGQLTNGGDTISVESYLAQVLRRD